MSEHQLWNELGNIYANAGVYDQAIKAYGKSIELEPGFGWSYSNLASVYVQQENYEKAVPLFQRSIELLTDVSGRTAAWMRLGEAYLKMGDYGDAILAYKRALELAPDDTALQEEIEIVLAELDCVQSEQVAVPADPSASQVKGNETGAADPLPTTEEGAEPVASAVQSELEQAEMLPEEESETAVSDTRDEFTVWFENLMTELGASGLAKLQAIVSGIDAGEVKPDAPAADSAPETFAAGLAAVVKARGIWSRIESVQESEPEVEMVAMVDPEAAVDETEAEIEAAVVLVEPEAQVVKTEPEVATGALTEPELAAAETEAEIEAAVVLVEPEGEVVETEPEVETVALAEPETVALAEPETVALAEPETVAEAEPEGEVAESEPEVEMVALVEVEPEGEVAETEPEVATVALAEPEGEVAETEPEVEMVALTESEVAVNASEATIENEAEDVAATVEIFNAALPSNGNGNKNNAPVWNALGNVFFNAAAFEEALMAYTRAIELDPDYGYAVHNLALTYVKTGRYQEALPLYNRGIDLLKDKHDKATSWNSLGNAYRMLDDYASAAKAYQAADELDPENLSLKVWTRSGLLSGTRI